MVLSVHVVHATSDIEGCLENYRTNASLFRSAD